MTRRILNMSSDPHICTLCATQGRTCCSLVPGNEELCFPISGEERQMIADWGGEAEFFNELPNSQAFRDSLDYLFPEDRVRLRELFPKHGRHWRLGTTPTGECLLLGPHGCRLPRANRPWYCRIFPFWVRWGEVMVIPSPSCLGVRKAVSKAKALELYSLTEIEVVEFFNHLRQAWALPTSSWFDTGTDKT